MDWLRVHIRRPLLARGHQAVRQRDSKQHILQPFQTFSMSSYNLCHPSKILSFQLADIRFYSLQQSVAGCCSPQKWTFLPSPDRLASTWGASYDILKYIEFAMRVQHTHKSSNWCSKTLQSDQNEVQMDAWSRSNQQKVRKVISNENSSIYHTSDSLGRQKYTKFLNASGERFGELGAEMLKMNLQTFSESHLASWTQNAQNTSQRRSESYLASWTQKCLKWSILQRPPESHLMCKP